MLLAGESPTVPGGFGAPAQCSELLREMDNAPRRSTRVRVPNPRFANADNTEFHGRRLGYAELMAAASEGSDPISLKEALSAPDADLWKEAMKYEMDMLHKAGTWELSDLPPGRRVVKSKWVYKLKADGRYRARLVAKGFTQIPGIDYDELSPLLHALSRCVCF